MFLCVSEPRQVHLSLSLSLLTSPLSTGQVRVPFPPTDVRVCELSDTYAVLSWTEPEPRGREPLTYFMERVGVDPRPTRWLVVRLIKSGAAGVQRYCVCGLYPRPQTSKTRRVAR